MKTTVVNLWKEPYDVYIGRAGHGQDGYFGNPIVTSCECVICSRVHIEAGTTIECYRVYFEWRLENDSGFKKRVLELKGKRLGCFCKPKPCHGDVIAEWLDREDDGCSTDG